MDAVKEKKGTMDLTEGSSFKKIIVFSIPLIIGNIFQLFYSWGDAIVIGKTDGAVAYGSITASMPVIFLILTVTNGFLTGAVVILSQLFSKKDEVGIKKSLNTILITMLVASLLVTVIGYFGTKPLLKLLKVSPEQIEGTTAYLQIYFLGSIAVVMYNTFNMILKSVGNSACYTYFQHRIESRSGYFVRRRFSYGCGRRGGRNADCSIFIRRACFCLYANKNTHPQSAVKRFPFQRRIF